MTLVLQDLDDMISSETQKAILYGDAKTGKTTLSGTLPGKKIMLSAERGLKSLKALPKEMRAQIQGVEIREIAKLHEAYDLLESGAWSCDWLVMDSISEFAEIALMENKRTKKDARQAYGIVEEEIMTMLHAFRELPVNVLFLCKEQVKQRQIDDATSIDYFNLMMPGNTLTNKVCHLVDELWRLTIKGGKRKLICQGDGRTRAGSRSGLPAINDVDDGLEAVIGLLTAPPSDD